MLGVRRAGVIVAAGILQRAGFIEYRHGGINVVDRIGLENAACPRYRIISRPSSRPLGLITSHR